MINIVKETILEFTEDIFEKIGYKKYEFKGRAIHKVKVIKESYGKKRGQHSFTVEVIKSTHKKVGEKFRKMGRNIYPTANIIKQPKDMEKLTKEKNKRSIEAREIKYLQWIDEARYEGKKHKLDKIPESFKAEHPELFEYL